MKSRQELQTKLKGVALAALFALLSGPALAAYEGNPFRDKSSSEQLEDLKGVGIQEKLGTQLDLKSMHFKDENGQSVTLAQYFEGGKLPVMISPVYFSCPGLCNFHLNGLTDGFKELDWNIGDKFRVLAISFDSRETPADAAKKKDTYMKAYGRPGAAENWHFLTGDADNVKRFTEAVGFNYKWNEKEKDWSHASAAIVFTPEGRISRYLPGIIFKPQDLKLALNEASSGKVGSFVDQVVLYCFQYNPNQSKYTLYAVNVMKLGGAVMVLILAIWLLPPIIRSRRGGPKVARS